MKTFSVVNSIAIVLTIAAAVLSILGVSITGFYPGVIVLFLLTLIPIASKFYVKKIRTRLTTSQRNCFTMLSILNVLTILVVLWMTFVIVHDRILQDCC
jgi:uncharacterized membrane protein